MVARAFASSLLLLSSSNGERAPLLNIWVSHKFDYTHAAAAGYNAVQTAGGACGIPLFSSIPGGPWYNDTEMQYNQHQRQAMTDDIAALKEAGLTTFWSGYDALSFPERLVDAYAEEMVDPTMTSCIGYKRSSHGCLSFKKNRTREVFSVMVDEFFNDFPEVDGLQFRYGEDSSCKYNVGNSPVDEADPIGSLSDFLQVLREELCEKRNKTVMFRTWDTNTATMHSNRSFYEAVLEKVEPHPRMIFSIKHTKLDFWRRTHFNPTIGAGKHKQVIEACTGNLFQGQGAYPSYIVDGYINGFEENDVLGDRIGLQDILQQPTFAGLRVVSQGAWGYQKPGADPPCMRCNSGGIPYPQAWPLLEFRVLGRWGANPERGEESAFLETVQEDWGLTADDAAVLRKAVILAMRANLYMETVGQFDLTVTQGSVRPSGSFMTQGSLGGYFNMGRNGSCRAGPGVNGRPNACEVVPWLMENATGYALSKQEKIDAVSIYEQVVQLMSSITSFPEDGLLQRHIIATGRHGLGHARLIRFGYEALVEGLRVTEAGAEPTLLCEAAKSYQGARADLEALFANSSGSIPTLLNDEEYRGTMVRPYPPGMGADVANLTQVFCTTTHFSSVHV